MDERRREPDESWGRTFRNPDLALKERARMPPDAKRAIFEDGPYKRKRVVTPLALVREPGDVF